MRLPLPCARTASVIFADRGGQAWEPAPGSVRSFREPVIVHGQRRSYLRTGAGRRGGLPLQRCVHPGSLSSSASAVHMATVSTRPTRSTGPLCPLVRAGASRRAPSTGGRVPLTFDVRTFDFRLALHCPSLTPSLVTLSLLSWHLARSTRYGWSRTTSV